MVYSRFFFNKDNLNTFFLDTSYDHIFILPSQVYS